jgi:enolase
LTIQSIAAFQIFDSRGNPTVEAEVTLTNGIRGRGLVPSGASTGQYEALELRDADPMRFRGRSVHRAIENIHTELAPRLCGMKLGSVEDHAHLDAAMIELDGTPSKGRLGANSILAVSLAACDAAARSASLPLFQWLGNGNGRLLPLPEIQIIGGGAHACWRTDIQDFLLIATGAGSYPETLEITFNVYSTAAEMLQKQGRFSGVADEGGFWPNFPNHAAILNFLVEAIERAGYQPGRDAAISLDIAASDLFEEATGKYRLRLEEQELDSRQFAELIAGWCSRYPIVSLEDPMADIDVSGWKHIRTLLSPSIQLVGDDLFTTNPSRIQQGIREGLANSVLIKPNQIGTVTETLQAIRMTQEAGWLPVISARSGETEDAFIAHLAVATNAGQLKVGSFTRSERMVKWNEVLRIERELGPAAQFEGARIFGRLQHTVSAMGL